MRLNDRLTAVRDSIQSFDVPQPPIISHDEDSRQALPGLRFLREEVKRECDRFLRESASLSTNAPYLVAVWDELVHARQPVAIYRTFAPGTSPQDKTRPVKVDVVAENGARWVRVNTIKNARLVMETDSYLTSDGDEDEPRPRLPQTEFDNSVVRMGRELLAAAKANPVSVSAPEWNSASTTITPQVTIRLTRLDPHLIDDPRVEMTIQFLRDMGIDVRLGEWLHLHSGQILKTPTKLKLLEPTTDINLDLSALIAIISDISHSPLPRTEQEAHARFEPPQSYLDWKKDRTKLSASQSRTCYSPHDVEDSDGGEGTWENPSQHSRALAAQAMQEMSKGFLEEIHERISAVVTQRSDVTFWTTREARHRCLQIVSKIGGEGERRRASSLLGSTLCAPIPPDPAPGYIPNRVTMTDEVLEATPGTNDAEWKASDAYWGHSRYSAGFLTVAPVRVYPSILPGGEAEVERKMTFFDALTQTCTRILSREAAPVSHVSATSDPLEETLEEIPPATKTLCPKLTVHTVTSMLAGASRGHTTLTTNRSSVKVVLKEMRRVYGRGGYEPEPGEVEKAALWVADPRSLSERMRTEYCS